MLTLPYLDSMSPARKRPRAPPEIAQRDVTPQPVKWQAIALAKEVSASALFSATGNALLAQLRANEPGAVLGHDPEYLHQMRVTVRRLRALLSLYSAMPGKQARKKADQELQRLAHALGPARDSDVFLYDIWPPLRKALGHGPLVKMLSVEWLTQQRRNARIAQRALASRRHQEMRLRLERWFAAQSWRDGARRRALQAWDQRARGLARRELAQRAQRVLVYGRGLKGQDAGALHRLRIDIKKLRYVMDAHAPLFKRARVHKMLQSLSALQDILGALNDAAVAEQKIGCALAKSERVNKARLQVKFATWHAVHVKALKRKLNDAWRAYRHARPFW